MFSPRLRAILLAFFVTFIWSASWVFIKIGLEDIPALSFAGLRYILAFLCLLAIGLRSSNQRANIRKLNAQQWRNLMLLGLILYAIAQGAQFAALVFLPSATLSLILNFTSIAVALGGIAFLAERPSLIQWLALGLFLIGVGVYFWPIDIPDGQAIGILIALVCLGANAIASLMGRAINRERTMTAFTVTLVSMGVGAILLLLTGLITEGLPRPSLQTIAIIIWLGTVHTAFTFPIWNHTLQTLTAIESSIINSTMLAQIALLAWIFLGESLNERAIIGLILASIAVLLVQIGAPRKRLTLSYPPLAKQFRGDEPDERPM